MYLRIARLAIISFSMSGVAMAQSDESAAVRDAWSKIYLDAAKEIVLISKNSDNAIELVEKPLMRWHNPVREGETHGDFFVWQCQGKPVLVGTIFSYILPLGGNTRVAAMGLHPLIKDDIRYEFRSIGGTLQTTNLHQFQIEMETPAGATDSRSRSLFQLRQLARSCQAWTVDGPVEHPLRLMPQPLLHFSATRQQNDELNEHAVAPVSEAPNAARPNAGLFAMVTGTDPELLLLIQNKPADEPGKSWWQITPARFTDLPINLNINGKEIWQRHTSTIPEPYVSRHQIFSMPLDPR